MVIIRVGQAARANYTLNIPLGNSIDHSLSAERRRRTQVHVMTLTESKVEYGQCAPTSSTISKGSPNEVKLGGEEEV